MEKTKRTTIVVSISLLLLLTSIPLGAQVTSTIQGHISDTTGPVCLKHLSRLPMRAQGFLAVPFQPMMVTIVFPICWLAPIASCRVVWIQSCRKEWQLKSRAQSITNLNITLEVGEVTQTVNVTGEESQVETSTARISEVLAENELRSLPSAGRGIYTLTMLTPGIQGKSEGGVGNNFCCDVFSNYNAPRISSGGNENKANYLVDGINLRYTEGSTWGIAFSPNPDAITEVRVSTNPTAAENGTISGPQVQLVTKGGTNEYSRHWPL